MELLNFPIQVPTPQTKIFVHVFADIHRAAEGCDSTRLRKDIAYIVKRRAKGELHFWIGNGDWSNGIGPKDKRYDATAVAPEFQGNTGKNLFHAEARRLIKEFEPIKQWGIGLGEGNHERSVAKNSEFNPIEYIAEKLELPFLGYSSVVRFHVSVAPPNKHTYDVVMFMHHGYGASRTKGAKANMLYSLRDVVQADVYVTGHVHELTEFPETRLSVTRRGPLKLVSNELLFVNNGTYLKAYPVGIAAQKHGKFNEDHAVSTDYAEMKGYRPSVIGHNGFCMFNSHTSRGAKSPGQKSYTTHLRHVDFR